MPWRVWKWSIERQLPVIFTMALGIAITGFSWAAYLEVRRSNLAVAPERLQRLVDLLRTSVRQLDSTAQRFADRPALRAYLRAPLATGRTQALEALAPSAAPTQMVLDVELWDANGTRLLATRADHPALAPEAAQTLIRSLAPDAHAAIGTIRRERDTLFYPLIAPVSDSGQTLGYVVQRRRISGSTQGGRPLAQLIGAEAIYIGNTDGSLWSDFATVVPGPPADARVARGVLEYRRPNDSTYVGALAPIPRTPWSILVEYPSRELLAPARAFARRLGFVALLLVTAGALTGWALSRRMVKLQRQVAEQTGRLRTVTDTANDAIISGDASGRIVFWNPGARQMFGYTAAEVIGRPLTMLMPERYHAPHHAGLERYVKTGVPHVVGRSVELEGRRKDGSEFPLELSLAAAQTDQGVTFTGVIRDITDRKRIEEALRETNAELESFAYSVSHDLRAPLRAIHGFGQILLEDHGVQLDAEARRLLGVMSENTRRMGQLIDDLLAFSRLGRKELDTTRVDVADLARTISDEVRRAEGDRALDITIGSLPPARADRQLLRQALTNLLQNAAKFTRRRDGARIEVGHRADGDQGVYYVKDNGAGFDPRYIDKLFGVFQRLHPEDQFEGTGVGLAIVQRIIHRHGGRVWAEGKVDAGATFYFTLPGDSEG